ncbi:MAG: hypothetical protein Q8O09_04255, partial [Bacillota bacterium]|nr:hypothetical protein [Bacillota bacterium]
MSRFNSIFISIILIFAFALSLAGCGAAPTPSSSPSQAEVSPSPTPDPMQEKLQMAPEITGLKKEIQEKDGVEKVVYEYEAGNPYGGKEDEYAGEFKKEVNETDPETGEVKEVGGVVLDPDIVLYMWNDMYEVLDPMYVKKTSLYTQEMMVPLDISSMQTEDTIDISYILAEGGISGRVVVDFTGGPLSITCPGKGENNYYINEIDPKRFQLHNPDVLLSMVVDNQGGCVYDAMREFSTDFITLDGDFIIDESSYPELIRDISFIKD